jgi:hypothetical protein
MVTRKKKNRRPPPWAIIVPAGATLTLKVEGHVNIRERAILVEHGGTLVLEDPTMQAIPPLPWRRTIPPQKR